MVAEGGEGENPLPFSLTAPKGGGGGRVGGVSRLRFPPSPHLRSSRFSRHPRLPTRRFAENRNFCGGKRPCCAAPSPGGLGPKPWRPGPQAPGAWTATLTGSLLLVASQTHGSATITPNPLTLGGVGWFPRAELYSPMRGVPAFAPAFQPLGGLGTWPTSP